MPFRLVVRVPIQLEEGAARISGMELHALEPVNVAFPRDPDAEFAGPCPTRLLRGAAVALADHHVTAVAVAALQEAPRRGAVPHRRDDFQKIRPDRKQGILQAEDPDSFVDETDLEAENGLQILGDRRQFLGHETDLPQTDAHRTPLEGLKRHEPLGASFPTGSRTRRV